MPLVLVAAWVVAGPPDLTPRDYDAATAVWAPTDSNPEVRETGSVPPVAAEGPRAGKAASAAKTATEPPAVPAPRRPIVGLGPPDRGPAGQHGGSFFDPGKLDDAEPLPPFVILRGYVGGSFVVTQRSNTRTRDDDGGFERLEPHPFFGSGTATLYVSTPVFAETVMARLALDYLSIPTPIAGTNDILAPAYRALLVESAALEVNPFAWAKKAAPWLRRGFKLTGGAFIVPFGIEDENHAAPVNWFSTRAKAMTTNRIYPGTWTDVGLVVKWKPSFGARALRPIEIDVGFINGDSCTQTRFADWLYRGSQASAVEVCEHRQRPQEPASGITGPQIDVGFLGIAPDNNRNKSVLARLQLFPVEAINVGGSFVWGKHPGGDQMPDASAGETIVDVGQAPTWRAGAHAMFDLDAVFDTRYPLPAARAEFVYGVDEAVEGSTTLRDRTMMGIYAEIAQPLFRRKRFGLPGLIIQYRFDHADPDLLVPGRVDGQVLDSDFSDPYRYDEAIQSHTIGLRLPVVPRFTIKADYWFQLEDGGPLNQLANDFFALQAVGDF